MEWNFHRTLVLGPRAARSKTSRQKNPALCFALGEKASPWQAGPGRNAGPLCASGGHSGLRLTQFWRFEWAVAQASLFTT
ncbi:hypothetical protein BDDG_13020 [Blastomyces dermatitidis ATCC 18188]|uniref:Uncharacterized protein n=1 Tax=Ajellomyces dermatitidis (strain ATCC 18188 / CBS 674.68) TaxID=653446 RepID=A0A0J9EUA5_AJEDA|nr:hypothetical protein BDDG_13020 [Blastomyces dermatitidis ATCC 18188]